MTRKYTVDMNRVKKIVECLSDSTVHAIASSQEKMRIGHPLFTAAFIEASANANCRFTMPEFRKAISDIWNCYV